MFPCMDSSCSTQASAVVAGRHVGFPDQGANPCPLHHVPLTAGPPGKVLVAQSYPPLCDPRTIACQASLSMGFSWQEYWSGLPFPPPRDLPNPGIEPGSPALQADSLQAELPGKPIHVTRKYKIYAYTIKLYLSLYKKKSIKFPRD